MMETKYQLNTRPKKDILSPRDMGMKRRCLGCGKLFESTWCGNRKCKKCADVRRDRGVDMGHFDV